MVQTKSIDNGTSWSEPSAGQIRQQREQRLLQELALVNERLDAFGGTEDDEGANDVWDSYTVSNVTTTTVAMTSFVSDVQNDESTTDEKHQAQEDEPKVPAQDDKEAKRAYWLSERTRVESSLQRLRDMRKEGGSYTTPLLPLNPNVSKIPNQQNLLEGSEDSKREIIPSQGKNKDVIVGTTNDETNCKSKPIISETESTARSHQRETGRPREVSRFMATVSSTSPAHADGTSGDVSSPPERSNTSLLDESNGAMSKTRDAKGSGSEDPLRISEPNDLQVQKTASIDPQDQDEHETSPSDDGRTDKTRTLQQWCKLLRVDDVVTMPDKEFPVLPSNIDDDGLKEIARAFLRGRDGIVQQLEKLDLSGCSIGDEGIRHLLEEVRLSLFHNPKSFRRCNLKSINLSNNPITAEVKEELVDIVHTIASITEFLVDNQTDETMRIIKFCTKARQDVEREREDRRRSKKERDAKKGTLQTNPEDENGKESQTKQEVVAAPPGKKIGESRPRTRKHRTLRQRAIRNPNFQAKRQLDVELSLLWSWTSDKSTAITDLNLSGRLIGDDGVESLTTALKVSGGSSFLKSLSLDGNKISERGGKVIAQYLSGREFETDIPEKDKEAQLSPPILEYLQLDWNNIGSKGAMAIGKALATNDELRELYLGRNRVGDEGAAAIAVALWRRREEGRSGGIVDLSLIGNDIGFIGMSTIANCLEPMASGDSDGLKKTPSVERLRLGDNPRIGKENGGHSINLLVDSMRTNISMTYVSLWRCSVSMDGEQQLNDLVTKRSSDNRSCGGGLTIYLDTKELRHDAEGGEKIGKERGSASGLSGSETKNVNESAEVTSQTATARNTKAERLLAFSSVEWEDETWGKGWYFGQLSPSGEPNGRGEFKTRGNRKVYEGVWTHGSRTGWGKAKWSDGSEYRGYWRNGYFHGRGNSTLQGDERRYEGEFIIGDRCGHGRQEYRDGSVYDGEWQNDLRHGHGILVSPKGKVEYEGKWKCGDREKTEKKSYLERVKTRVRAMGSFVRRRGSSSFSQSDLEEFDEKPSKTKKEKNAPDEPSPLSDVKDMEWIDYVWGFGEYTGSVDAMKRPHGEGSFRSEEGHCYKGEYRVGERTGVGKATWVTGTTYDGEWYQGRRHGKGENVAADGVRYSGWWSFNEKHGDGERVLADGSKKYGEWRFNIFVMEKRKREILDSSSDKIFEGNSNLEDEVVGFLHFDSMWGSGRYEGEIEDTDEKPIPCGEGVLTMKDGRWYDGQWENGCRHGKGIACWPVEGMEYDGDWENGKRHGFGSAVWDDGTRFQGEWKDNKRHGEGIIIKSNGDFWKGRWKYDERCLM